MIFVGCSGFQYQDWKGKFYPNMMPQEKYLEYYTTIFNTVEIDSTYYSFPGSKTVDSWIAKVGADRRFKMSLKFPKDVSHDPDGITENSIAIAEKFVNDVIMRIRDEGILGAGLIQLSPFIDPLKKPSVINDLTRLFERLDTSTFRLAFEVRNRNFLNEPILSELLIELKRKNIAFSSVDSPALPRFYENTADFSYLRFHGQNKDIWYGKGDLQGRLNKYDYLYEDYEMIEWKNIVSKMNGDVYVYFNNHAQAKAATNAIQFSNLLGLKNAHISGQRNLTEF